MAPASGRDLVRQIAVLAATTFMLIAATVGAGVLGGIPVAELQDGALSAEATPLAPAAPAFSIWSVVYLGLIVYAVWQALPGRRADERQRRLGWRIAGTEVLNGLWLVAAQFATLWLTVLVIVLLLAALCVVFVGTVRLPAHGWADRLLVDGVTGLHLGWVTLATVANAAAWLKTLAPETGPSASDVWAVVVLVAVAVIGTGLVASGGGRIAPALALAWGLSWVAVGRLAGEPASVPAGVAAAAIAALLLLVAVVRRVRTARRSGAASVPAR